MPFSATSIFATDGIDTLVTDGIDVVTTKWDDDGVQVLFDVNLDERRAPLTLYQESAPTGLAVVGSSPAKIYWLERFTTSSGEARMYEADASVTPPLVRTITYPFPQAAGGQLYVSAGGSRILAVDLSRDTFPHLLVAVYDPGIGEWLATADLGLAPGRSLRFTASRGNFYLESDEEENLLWFFDESASFTTASARGPSVVLGPSGEGMGDVLAADFGYFTGVEGPLLPIVLTEENNLFLWDPNAQQSEDFGRAFYGHAPDDTQRLQAVDFSGDGRTDVFVLRSNGTLTAMINNGVGATVLAQDFPLLEPCENCALNLSGNRSLHASSDKSLILFQIRPVRVP